MLVSWRESADIRGKVALITKSLSFNYENRTKKDGEDTENVAFINVAVAVKGDREMAEYITKRLHTIMPGYVERAAEKYVKNINAECTLITPFSDVRNLSSGRMLTDMVKNGVLACIVILALYGAFVVAYNLVKRAMNE